MTGEIAHEDYMSLFNDSQRRYRRNALCNIFDGFEEERISFLHHLAAEFISATDENGELVACTAVESPSSASSDSCCSSTSKDLDFPSKDNSEESSPSSSVDTARPSCLVGLTSCSSHSSSSSSSTTSPSSMSSQTSSSVASLSSSGEGKVRSCSSDTHGFTTSPTSSMCYNISFSRVRRNALHDLLETLTQDDIEKLKNLYQTTLSTAYSLNPFSEQTQSPIRGFHECKAWNRNFLLLIVLPPPKKKHWGGAQNSFHFLFYFHNYFLNWEEEKEKQLFKKKKKYYSISKLELKFGGRGVIIGPMWVSQSYQKKIFINLSVINLSGWRKKMHMFYLFFFFF